MMPSFQICIWNHALYRCGLSTSLCGLSVDILNLDGMESLTTVFCISFFNSAFTILFCVPVYSDIPTSK